MNKLVERLELIYSVSSVCRVFDTAESLVNHLIFNNTSLFFVSCAPSYC